MSQLQQSGQQQHRSDRHARAGGQSGNGGVQAPVGQQFPTRSYLADTVRTTSVGLLNQAVADLSAVSMQLQHAHWNVKGIEFYQLHELFGELYETFQPLIDDVAERASALGGEPMGTAMAVAQQSTIPPLSPTAADGQTFLRELADRLAVLDANLYQQIEVAGQQGDEDTADLLTEVSREVTKALWFVESHLQQPQRTGGGERTGAVKQ